MFYRYADATFASCKDIQGLTPGSTVLDLMCGGWGRDCTPERWLNFMGSTPDDNGFSPFEIKYHLTNDRHVMVDGKMFLPMNENTTAYVLVIFLTFIALLVLCIFNFLCLFLKYLQIINILYFFLILVKGRIVQ